MQNAQQSITDNFQMKIYTADRQLDYIPDGNAVCEVYKSNHLKDRSKVVFTCAETGNCLTAENVHDATMRLATILKEKYSIRQNRVVCLFLYNNHYMSIIHHAILSLGAIVSPANVVYNGTELSHQIQLTEPAIVIADHSVKSTAAEGAKLAGANSTNIVDFEQFRQDIKAALNDKSIPMSDVVDVNGRDQHAYYCFSSGTSGLAKCVITTHTNISVNLMQLSLHGSSLSIPDLTVGAILPLSHIFGLQVYLWTSLYLGCNTVVFKTFELEKVLAAIVQYEIVGMAVVPPLVLAFAKSPLVAKYPIHKYLKHASSGAAPLSKSTIRDAEIRIPGLTIDQLYGQTETSPVTIGSVGISNPDKRALYDKGSIGWLVPSTEARIINPDTLEDAPRGSPGELWLRGPQVMKGYLHNSKATEEALVGGGWLRTGDVCVLSPDGQFTIVDRIKELIKSKGHQVAPAELEGLLLKHDEVIDAAVIGVMDDEGVTELPRAYLVLNKDSNVERLASAFNASVSIHKRLWGGIVVLEQIPKSPSGKILRKDLRMAAKYHVAVAVPKRSKL